MAALAARNQGAHFKAAEHPTCEADEQYSFLQGTDFVNAMHYLVILLAISIALLFFSGPNLTGNFGPSAKLWRLPDHVRRRLIRCASPHPPIEDGKRQAKHLEPAKNEQEEG